jgi:hypothetical protein
MRMTAHGVDVDVPRGWDGEIYRRRPGVKPLGGAAEQTNAVLHLGSFPLPSGRGDYGSGAVEVMRPDDVFVALFEFGSDSVGKALFSSVGIPTVSAHEFAPHTMQRPLPGQSGAQYFFTSSGRAFCLYVALGSHARRRELVPEINRILGSLRLEGLG